MKRLFVRAALVRVCLVLLALAALAVASPAAPAAAQIAPADSAAVLMEAARTFEERDQWDVALALYRHVAERYGSTRFAEQARERIRVLSVRTEGSGATELQVWATTYGLWLGVAVPAALGADGPEPYGLGLLVGGPLGFMAGRNVARSKDLSIGQARAITLGGTWGTWQGFGWQEVFDLGVDHREECYATRCFDVRTESDTEETFAAMVIGGLTGIGVGAALSRRPITDATATAANVGALYGSWFGTALSVLAGLDDDALLAGALIGGNAGLATAALSAPGLGWSRSRWRVVSAAGLLGGLGGGGLDLLLQPDDEKVAIAIPLLTSIAGLALGVASTRDDPGAVPGGNNAAGPGREDDSALLAWNDGGLRFGTPVPTPTLRPVDRPGRSSTLEPAVGLTLFRAVFR